MKSAAKDKLFVSELSSPQVRARGVHPKNCQLILLTQKLRQLIPRI
jgi:hypothetical protein